MISNVKIIAEAGVNHNGKLSVAKKLVDIAKSSGADFIKFQLYISKNLALNSAKKAAYQEDDSNESQLKMLKKLEISHEDFKKIYNYCKKQELKCFATAFDLQSLFFLKDLGQEIFKIPSGEITNYPLLKAIGSFNSQVILSTGMSNIDEISKAISVLVNFGTKKNNIIVLHCTTEYPAPLEELNLKAIQKIKNDLKVRVGYSDHSKGIDVPIAAISLGAEIIEKHFTLDKKMEGPDHKASLDPRQLKSMIKNIRAIETALGKEKKVITRSEKKNRDVIRKSIVAKRIIKKGQIICEEDLEVKRPGYGLSPMKWNDVIGSKAKKDFKEDELISI